MLRNRLFNYIVVSLSFFIIALTYSSVIGKSNELLEDKHYCYASVEDEFVDDSILVVLSKKASYSGKTYNKNDFSTYECVKVDNLTKEASRMAIEKTNNPLINLDNYRCVLRILLREKSKENVLNVINELIKRDDVIYAGPDYIMHSASTSTNDCLIDEQWGISSTSFNYAWDYVTGNNNVIVGVIDTGIDSAHPDLNGRVITALSRDFTGGSEATVTTVTDLSGHGTNVAGIIGAVGDNGIGIAGTNWNGMG